MARVRYSEFFDAKLLNCKLAIMERNPFRSCFISYGILAFCDKKFAPKKYHRSETTELQVKWAEKPCRPCLPLIFVGLVWGLIFESFSRKEYFKNI